MNDLATVRALKTIRLVRGCRRSRRLGWAVVTLLTLAIPRAGAHDFGDDVGDVASCARSIVSGSNYTGRIEIDVDSDYFAFQATNSMREYVVTVTTGTLWNSSVSLVSPDGVYAIADTTSVFTNASRISWIHVGPPATYYVRVGGFAEFTTGTYNIAVTEQSFADLDHDGMPDAWESAAFGSTNQPASGPNGDYDHDGVDNIDEFRAGTDPADSNSFLRVTDVSPQATHVAVAWQAAPYRCYNIESATNLIGGAWDPLGTVTNLNSMALRWFDDQTTPSPPARFYRIRCLY